MTSQLRFIDKPQWYRTLRTLQAILDDDGQRFALGRYIDDMGLPKEEVQRCFARMWAVSGAVEKDFEDMLAVFCMETMTHELPSSQWSQENYDRTIARVLDGLIAVAAAHPELHAMPGAAHVRH